MAVDYKDNSKEIIDEINKVEDIFLELFIQRVKQKTPVRTGTLQAGWEGENNINHMIIRNDVEYASYVEYGTEKMAPRGMLTSTINESESILKEARDRTKLKS